MQVVLGLERCRRMKFLLDDLVHRPWRSEFEPAGQKAVQQFELFVLSEQIVFKFPCRT